MNIQKSSIFRRLLFWIAGTGLLVAIVSGLAHYLYTARLIQASVENQMQTALQSSLSHFKTTYEVPVFGDLRLLDSSPVVDNSLISLGADIYLSRPATERLFLSVVRANPNLYSSIRLVDVDGMEKIIVDGGKRVRSYVSVLQHAQDNNFRAKMATLFTRLNNVKPGDILFEGPIEHGDKTVSVLAGIAKREPEIGGFGGTVVAHVDLTDYLAHLSNFKIFGQTMAWLFDKTGKVILRPVPDEASASPSPDPSAYLFGQEEISHGALIFASDGQADQRMLGLFRIALSMSPEVFSAQLRGANLITLLVLIATVLFASIIAFLVAKQFAFPIRALSQLATSVGTGNLEAQVSEEWGGELGQLAAAFNRMVQRLKKTTFSKAYVDNIIRSMNDTLVVIRHDATIEKTNDALLALLGYEEHELSGHPLRQILGDSSVQRAVMEVASHDKFIAGIETTYVAKDGRKIPVSLSSSVMRDHDSKVHGFVCVAQDITERKKAEAELERIRRQNELILNSAGEGIYGLDLQGRTTFANPAAAKMIGWEIEELIGKPQHDILHHTRLDGSPYPREECPIYAALKDGAVHHLDNEVFWRKDGSCFPVEYISTPIREHDKVVGAVVSFRDITERKQAEETLRRYERIVSASRDLMAFIDSKYTYQAANKAYLEAFGKSREEIIGYTVAEILGTEIFDMRIKRHLDQCLTGKHRNYQHWLELPALGRRYLDVHYDPFYEADGSVSGVAVNVRDITEAHNLSDQLSYQATHDGLTGLINRREFERRLERVLESAKSAKTEHALCYLDLDQFKVINDTCGHVAGDELLRQLGELLQKQVRKRDTLSRLGGDEFGVLIEHCSLGHAKQIAKELRKVIQDVQFVWEDKNFSLGVSIGLVPITADGGSITNVLSMADTACYAAKDKGTNRIHVYREDDTELARRYGEMQWVSRINRALEENRFHLVFQPIVPVAGLESLRNHYELLLRLEDEDGSTVWPDSFLPAAERYNLSTNLDRWVIGRAFRWLADYPQHLKRLFLCSINLSGHSLGNGKFLEFVIQQFEETNLPPQKICFEITETVAIANLTSATRFIKALSELGCRFALDDFGSGLSSFAYLKNLPVDFLKIDGMFVKDIVDDPIDFAMVRSINEIGHVMGKQTIAEFVENEDILEKLREIGVDYAQGYGIGRPRPIEEITRGIKVEGMSPVGRLVKQASGGGRKK